MFTLNDMDFEVEWSDDKDMYEFNKHIAQRPVRNLVTDLFIYIVRHKSQEEGANLVVYQLKLLKETVEAAIKVNCLYNL